MEINFFEKLWKNFVSNGSTKIKKNLDLNDSLEQKEAPISFHIGLFVIFYLDCKFSRKKICYCKVAEMEFRPDNVQYLFLS